MVCRDIDAKVDRCKLIIISRDILDVKAKSMPKAIFGEFEICFEHLAYRRLSAVHRPLPMANLDNL